MKRAVEKKMAFDFSYLILICKLYKVDSSKKKKSKKNLKKGAESDIMWSNPEEEIIDQVRVVFQISLCELQSMVWNSA